MANTIRIKRRASGGATGAPASLATAELAFNEVDNILYIGFGDGGSGNATSIKALAGEGGFTTLGTTQTISGAKTFSTLPAISASLSLSDSSTNIATTAFVKGQNYLTTNESITLSGDASGSGTTAITVSISAATVTGKLLTGYSVGSNTALAATDTILQAFQKLQGQVSARLTTNETITVSGDATGSGTTAITLTLASVGTAGTYTKVTTDSKGRVTSGTTLSASDIPTLTASKISDFDTQVRTNRLDQLAAPTASVSLNGQKITNLADPVDAQDAATKAYVDAARTGLDVKASVRVASSSPISVTYSATGGTSTRGQITGAPNSLDGVSLAQGNRVLLKDQATGAQNGIWVVTTLGSGVNGVWDRATDFDTDAEVTPGAFTFVEEGTNADSGWVLTNDGAITIGGASGTALVFTQFSGAGQITAGAGLTKTGSTLDVGAGTGISVTADAVALTGQALAFHNLATSGMVARTAADTVAARTIQGTSNRISLTNGDGVSGDPTIDISSAYVGQTSITTLGTIGTGTWQGTAVALGYGGTGANLSAASDGTIFKKSGTALVAATAGADYLNDSSTIIGGTF